MKIRARGRFAVMLIYRSKMLHMEEQKRLRATECESKRDKGRRGRG